MSQNVEYVFLQIQQSLEKVKQASRVLQEIQKSTLVQGGEGDGADGRANCYKIIEGTAPGNSTKRAYVECPHCPWSKLFPSWTDDGFLAFAVDFTKNVGCGNPFRAKTNSKGVSDDKACPDHARGLLHKLFKTSGTGVSSLSQEDLRDLHASNIEHKLKILAEAYRMELGQYWVEKPSEGGSSLTPWNASSPLNGKVRFRMTNGDMVNLKFNGQLFNRRLLTHDSTCPNVSGISISPPPPGGVDGGVAGVASGQGGSPPKPVNRKRKAGPVKTNSKQRSRHEWRHASDAEDNEACVFMYNEGDPEDPDSSRALWEALVGGPGTIEPHLHFRPSSLLLLDLMYNVQFLEGANDDAWAQIDPKEHLKLVRCIGGYVHRTYADVC